jgi:hypothetical protein
MIVSLGTLHVVPGVQIYRTSAGANGAAECKSMMAGPEMKKFSALLPISEVPVKV